MALVKVDWEVTSDNVSEEDVTIAGKYWEQGQGGKWVYPVSDIADGPGTVVKVVKEMSMAIPQKMGSHICKECGATRFNPEHYYCYTRTDVVNLGLNAVRRISGPYCCECNPAIISCAQEVPKSETLGTQSYAAYLKSPKWKRKKDMAMERADYKCQLCGYRPDQARELSIHHNTYENVGCEDLEDLICLCKTCHSLAHHKMFLRSPIPFDAVMKKLQQMSDMVAAFR